MSHEDRAHYEAIAEGLVPGKLGCLILFGPEAGWQPDVCNANFQTRSNRYPLPHSRVTPHPVFDDPEVARLRELYLTLAEQAAVAFHQWQAVENVAHEKYAWLEDVKHG